MDTAQLKEKLKENWVLSVIIIIWAFIIGLGIFFYRILRSLGSNTANTQVNVPPKNLLSITSTGIDTNVPINFFYIKSSFNSCINYTDNTVNLSILEKIISQGVRVFDFEIFNINSQAIISTSTDDNPLIKETMGENVLFSSAMDILVNQAFNSLNCSNYTDPLFIYIRMNTSNIDVYNNIASTLGESQYDKYLLNIDQGYTYSDNFLANTSLKDVINKIVIIVFSPDVKIENTNLNAYVNVNASLSTPFFKEKKYQVIRTENAEDTITYCKKNTIFVTPDIVDGSPDNPEPPECLKLGVQFIGMSYQVNDDNLEAYQNFFDEYKCAFIMKNKVLLPEQTNLTIPSLDPSSNPHQCNQIMMNGKVVSEFGSGCT